MPGTRIRYKGADQVMTVTLIHAWHRGDIPAPIMSASSGPKSYLKNDVFYLFETNPQIEAVLMVRGKGPTFFLLRLGQTYFDVHSNEVLVESVEELYA